MTRSRDLFDLVNNIISVSVVGVGEKKVGAFAWSNSKLSRIKW
jgi:hypothetical protein